MINASFLIIYSETIKIFARFIVQSEIVVTFVHLDETISAPSRSSGQIYIVLLATKIDFAIALP